MLHLGNSSLLMVILLGMIGTSERSCNSRAESTKEEQITIDSDVQSESDSVANLNGVKGNVSFNQMVTFPNSVVLNGMSRYRLVTIYKSKTKSNKYIVENEASSYQSYVEEGDERSYKYFMPGLDILYGYNLVNIAHYDLVTDSHSYFFNRPVLIKTLYYPGVRKDSLNGKPINRDYFLVSVYDEDTNKDTLINKKDLRRFYYFDGANRVKTQLVTGDYSVLRSQYDSQNDVMYLFAKLDKNKNGTPDNDEPIHVFWISLNNPGVAKRVY